MTDQIEATAEDYINKIDSLGGMISAIEKGFVQHEIQRASYEFEKQLESGEKTIVGINKFKSEDYEKPELLKIDMKIQGDQIKFLSKVRAERNNGEASRKIAALENAASGEGNLMPFILDAVKAYCSLGEISDTLRKVFGEYKETVVI
jgi:methylmalonyl-CoA mutase N-terminal domain/subunit